MSSEQSNSQVILGDYVFYSMQIVFARLLKNYTTHTGNGLGMHILLLDPLLLEPTSRRVSI